ncbi:DNA replication protein DnaC [Olsenella profusa DSM 13989]|uniref:ATP-binding protein n=1 Tax=Olsenella profusa TaxID=138595 RepID=UPI0027869B91|nr:ATP-binding protein [Olsenella profusa]MDP9859626.1 DNA replication protein DnaC [Olsenella profusa DSM 13989]
MLDPETRRELREPRVPSKVEAVEMLESDASLAALPLDDRLRTVVDHAYQEMEDARAARLLRDARLRLPQADVANIGYDGRPLDHTPVTELATCQLVASATYVIAEGLTGTGKGHLARALGKRACKRGLKTLYVRMPDMLVYRTERMSAG